MRSWLWIVALTCLAACGSDGGGGSVTLELRPGQTASDVLPIATDVDGGELLSCDLAALVRSDSATAAALEQLEVELGDLAPDGERTCAVSFSATADLDAVSGEYRLLTKLFYTFRGAFGVETSAVNGTIRITIRG